MRSSLLPRHCERKRSNPCPTEQGARWIASSLALLAMTTHGWPAEESIINEATLGEGLHESLLLPVIASASEAIHVRTEQGARWIASSLALLAMTTHRWPAEESIINEATLREGLHESLM
jgi:exopolyphosphatase/pppGpp-phosphohydrolase